MDEEFIGRFTEDLPRKRHLFLGRSDSLIRRWRLRDRWLFIIFCDIKEGEVKLATGEMKDGRQGSDQPLSPLGVS